MTRWCILQYSACQISTAVGNLIDSTRRQSFFPRRWLNKNLTCNLVFSEKWGKFKPFLWRGLSVMPIFRCLLPDYKPRVMKCRRFSTLLSMENHFSPSPNPRPVPETPVIGLWLVSYTLLEMVYFYYLLNPEGNANIIHFFVNIQNNVVQSHLTVDVNLKM